MRTGLTLTIALALSLSLTLPSTLVAGEVVLRTHPPETAPSAVRPLIQPKAGSPTALLGEKVDEPADILLVPFFDVDTLDGSGTTTLFAVRNTSTNSIELDLRYLAPSSLILRQDLVTLGPRETLTRNVRDVPGLPADPDGHARGYIAIVLHSMAPTPNNLVGDYLQVDVGNNFATGDRLVSFLDLCEEQEIRFLDFGAGTELRLLINNPQGPDPMTNSPSFTVTPLSEDGGSFPSTDVYTDKFAVTLSASDFTGLGFGTLVFDFSNSGGGLVYGEYSAGGKFSVGLNGACTIQ